MTRQQNLLFKIAARGRGGGFMNRMTFAGGGNQFAGRSTGLNGARGSLVQTPGQRTTTGGTSWAQRSGADVNHAIAQRTSPLNREVDNYTKALRDRTQIQKQQPYDYAGNSVFTSRAIGKPVYDVEKRQWVIPTVHKAFNKDRVQQQLDRQQQDLRNKEQQLAKMKPTNPAQLNSYHSAYNTKARELRQASDNLNQMRNSFMQAQNDVNARMAQNINKATGYNITGDQYAAMKHDIIPGTKGVRVNQMASGTTDSSGVRRDATWNNTAGANQYVAGRAADRATYSFDRVDENGNPIPANAARAAFTSPGQIASTPDLNPGKEAMNIFYSHIGKKPTGWWERLNNDVAGWFVDRQNQRQLQDYRALTQRPHILGQQAPVGSRRWVNMLNYDPEARGQFMRDSIGKLIAQKASSDPTFLSGQPDYMAPAYTPTSDPYYWQYQQTI